MPTRTEGHAALPVSDEQVSFIEEGDQPIPADLTTLRYGCSVTDPCLGWDDTAAMRRDTRALRKDVLAKR